MGHVEKSLWCNISVKKALAVTWKLLQGEGELCKIMRIIWKYLTFSPSLYSPLVSGVFCAAIHRFPPWLDPLLRTCWRSCWWRILTGGWALDHEGRKTSKRIPSLRSSSLQLSVTQLSFSFHPLSFHPNISPSAFCFQAGVELVWLSTEEAAGSIQARAEERTWCWKLCRGVHRDGSCLLSSKHTSKHRTLVQGQAFLSLPLYFIQYDFAIKPSLVSIKNIHILKPGLNYVMKW